MQPHTQQGASWDHGGEGGSNNTSNNHNDHQSALSKGSIYEEEWEVFDARPILTKASFFMGDLRDGLPMVRILRFPFLAKVFLRCLIESIRAV